MTEPNNLPVGDEPHQHWRAGGIARVVTAIAAGVTMGWATRDVSVGITTTTAAMNMLREVFVGPRR